MQADCHQQRDSGAGICQRKAWPKTSVLRPNFVDTTLSFVMRAHSTNTLLLRDKN